MIQLVRFTATWCGPCKAYAPVLAKFANDHGLTVSEVDVDADPQARDLYSVTSVPTTLVVDGDGNELKRFTGARPRAALARELEEYI